MSYHQLTGQQRYQIERMMASGNSKQEISVALGVHRSTIYREIERNSFEIQDDHRPDYDSVAASGLARDRRAESCESRYKVSGQLKDYVHKKLKTGWSPEQIAGRAKLEKNWIVSCSSIYRFIDLDSENPFGEFLYRHLRRFTKKRRRRPKKRKCHGRKGAPKKSIRERPIASDLRSEIGHLERDLMEGPRKEGRAVLVIADRKSRRVTLRFVKKNGADVQKLTAKVLRQKDFRSTAKTITNDNGSEFIPAISKRSEEELGVSVFFCAMFTLAKRNS